MKSWPTEARDAEGVQQLRDEILLVRRSVWPLREVISLLERAESPLVDKTTAIYFRDVYEHTIQVMDTVDTYRDILSGTFDIYLSSISNRLNEVMKVLTNHCDDLHAPDLSRRRLRDELRTHAGAQVAIRLLYALGCDDRHCADDALVFQEEEMDLRGRCAAVKKWSVACD